MTSPWTSALDAELERRRAAGESFSVIGRAMGISKNAAIGRARRIGLFDARPARTAPSVAQAASVFPPPGHCRFSLSARSPHVFCGEAGDPWCPAHRAIVFQPKGAAE